MACNSSGSGCQSGHCRKNDAEPPRREPVNGEGQSNPKQCSKCKVNIEVSLKTVGGGDLCGDCFRTNVYGKFRKAVTCHAMITPSDDVLVAFSGGASSRVALQFVHDLQRKKQMDFNASKNRALRAFDVAVVFVDERIVHPGDCGEFDKVVRDMGLIVSNLGPPVKKFHVVPIESVYGSVTDDGKEKLVNLIGAVGDETGREDLLLHLRMLALQKVAVENGYTKIVLGSCTSRIARHVLAATVKGQGFSLSADIQYVDARWEIPLVLPLRDCTSQELNSICSLDGLKTVLISESPSSSINNLISSFATLVQEEHRSRECIIVRTAGKLTPFHFNKVTEINDSNVPLATLRRLKRYNIQTKESLSSESFCHICNSPMKSVDLSDTNCLNSNHHSSFSSGCCSSCQFQILPKDPLAMEQFYSLLPEPIMLDRTRHQNHSDFSSLREQIQDFLLSDTETEL